MIGPGSAVRVYLARGSIDTRKGIDGLAALVQADLRQKPTSGAVFAFRCKRGDRIKLLFWDEQSSACFTRFWIKAASPGHRRRTAPRG
jgi:transposase